MMPQRSTYPSTPSSIPSNSYDPIPLSPSSPRQLPKLRLMLSSSTPWRPTRGHKRHREEDIEIDGEDYSREEKRPTIKLKFRNPVPSQTSFSSSRKEAHPHTHTTLTSTPTYISSFGSIGESSSSSSRMDIDSTSRPSTPTPNLDPQGPVTKRPRSHSTSSSIVGLLMDETDTTPSSPVDTTSNSIATIPSTPNLSTASKSHSHSHIHVPSPLASTPILGVPLEPPSFNRAISDPSPCGSFARDIDMTQSLSPGPGPIDSKLTKTRHKLFMAEVEALGTEMNNVFKLGYGRGMGRGLAAGGRGPSKLRSRVQTHNQGRRDTRDMDVDE
ncbi:hypothetical protein I302_100548 [Kwoniella bestiolae CBS 10118]|uniref:Uncharacterized protein n=1 Tax=Kwoniella bestiolae CBS 10118 TaxID=1296100 RepID=A0A1B9G5D8_9TREE|nr:hypothetical protein I302_03923 [Kwoniella bestiolae CBS 10118]OCF26244.1 hypothetical protein I302_03923 [Kwoniella bestiolae CBS 10118]